MEVTLNKSWHLWLANFGAKRIWPECGTDICEYTRAVMSGTLWFSIVVFFITLMASWVGFSLYDIAMAIFAGDKITPPTVIFVMVVIALLMTAAAMAFKEWYENRPVKDGPPVPPSFPKVVYRKFKDKTCFRIKFNVQQAD
jgi:hypothetical protein